MKPFKLSDKLLFGTATASVQNEGGDTKNNWYRWSEQGKIANNESCITGTDHYNRYAEDIDIMTTLNQDVYRMSLEWSRFEPEQGIWDPEAVEHYRAEISLLLEKGIKPLVTLHHFTAPIWFDDEGGWVNPKSVEYFQRYTEKVVNELGDLVSEFCTINEPNVLVQGAYMEGNHPPGHKDDMKGYFKASKHLILSHLKAYKLIHRIRKERGFEGETKVGFAHHIAIFEVVTKNPLTRLSKFSMDYAFHRIYLDGMIEGHLDFPMGGAYPEGKGTFCDFFGLNYYSRHIIKSSMNPAMLFGDVTVDDTLGEDRLNDLGWEIYPEGMHIILKKMYDKYKLPIYITENGIADHDDSHRAKFLYDHLKVVQQLIEEGVDIQRYYYWTLTDNFEWDLGYAPRFGLVDIDYDNNMKRTIRKSGYLYGEISREKAITQAMIDKYLS